VQRVSVWKKWYMVYDFFIARRIVGTFYTFFFFSVLIPLNILLPEAQIPVWELIYIPIAITLLNSVGTPRLDWCFKFTEFYTCKTLLENYTIS
jgi:beta-mannan synthase